MRWLPDQLKSKIGSERIELKISEKSSFEKAQAALKSEKLKIDEQERIIGFATKDGVNMLREGLQKLEKAGIKVDNVAMRRPTLDDVFLSLTGHGTEVEKSEDKK